MNEIPKGSKLLISDSMGIYIPQLFVRHFLDKIPKGQLNHEEQAILSNPDHEHYWEVWAGVLQNVTLVDNFDLPESKQHRYYLYQDGDLWAIPEGSEWPEDE